MILSFSKLMIHTYIYIYTCVVWCGCPTLSVYGSHITFWLFAERMVQIRGKQNTLSLLLRLFTFSQSFVAGVGD
jgi:hypothetical protein